MKIHTAKIADLIAAEYNPRKLSQEQRDNLADSLKRFGLVDPVIVNKHPDRDNILVGGHQRTKVWKDLGNDTIPAVFVELDRDRERELNVRLNKNTGDWDMEALLAEFDTDELVDWGWAESELAEFEELIPPPEVEEDDFDCEPPEEPKTELGRIYQLGKHRLMCGDSTCEKTVGRLMDGEKADMVFTDPPFDMEYQSVQKTFEHFPDVLAFYILCDRQSARMTLDYEDRFYSTFILVTKNSLLVSNKQPIVAHCMIPCFNFRNARRDLNQVYTVVEAGRDLHMAGKGASHAKSLKTYEQFFSNWLDAGDLIVDYFGHSGSSLVAAHGLGRRCYMMELDPGYCDVIVRRYCELTNQDAEAVFETGVAE